ncbi:MAG: SLC13 family permease [Saprospiraceae bacterium]|nr:SLC13 family permease [Saprospiraceae bacterium]
MDAYITIFVILGTAILFITEKLPVDLAAMLAMITLVISGVITPEEGVKGFSNKATITVAFMFVLSASLLKTGALQNLAFSVSDLFQKHYSLGVASMMGIIALISAFVNNTPVVAVFIPVVIQIAYSANQAPEKLLIPLSYASIMGGMCTLIGTSTNLLVSEIAESNGLPGFTLFQFTSIGLILSLAGMLYMYLVGKRLLPQGSKSQKLADQLQLRDYLCEIKLLSGNESVGKRIMDSPLVRDLHLDIQEIRRNGLIFNLPQGDFVLQADDTLKVRSDIQKIKSLKERVKIIEDDALQVGRRDLRDRNASLIELVITSDSPFINKTLKSIDFRRQFRATVLAIRHREAIVHEKLYSVPLQAGDIILAEAKTHYIPELKKREAGTAAPFVILSEDHLTDFNRPQFYTVLAIAIGIVLTASLQILPIMISVISGVLLLALLGIISMQEMYKAINWKIIFLLAGALSLGQAMQNSGLDQQIGHLFADQLSVYGPWLVLAALYFITSILTELMSNSATAALLAPIAIATANELSYSPMPFLIAVTIAASASFMTPIGYQTNTMVYSAGKYKFKDFFKVGVWLNIMLWILSTVTIPLFFPF